MLVKELIEKLQEYDGELMVVVDGYEDGCDDPYLRLTKLKVGKERETHYLGLHEEIRGYSEGTEALCVSRNTST